MQELPRKSRLRTPVSYAEWRELSSVAHFARRDSDRFCSWAASSAIRRCTNAAGLSGFAVGVGNFLVRRAISARNCCARLLRLPDFLEATPETYDAFVISSICFRKNLARASEDSSASSSRLRAATINRDLAGNFVVSNGVGVKRSIVARKLPVIFPLSTPRLWKTG